MKSALIQDAPVHLIKAGNKEEFALLGVCLLAHLKSLLSGCVFWGPILANQIQKNLQTLGAIFTKEHTSLLVGKAFEIAVAELFHRKNNACYFAIIEGLQIAAEKRKSSNVNLVKLGDLDNHACIRFGWPELNPGALEDVESFKLIKRANCGIGRAMEVFPRLTARLFIRRRAPLALSSL